MAFEPRILRPDDSLPPDEQQSASPALDARGRSSAEEEWLPDDLQELAVQLGVDAARLLDGPGMALSERGGTRWWRRLPRIAIAAALLASAGVWLAARGERPAGRLAGLASSTAEFPATRAGDRVGQPAIVTASGDPASIAGDLIVEVSGQKIQSVDQAVDLILTHQPGETIGLVVERAGERRPIKITLGSEPDASMAERHQALIRNGSAANIAELSVGGSAEPQRGPRDELSMLQLQVQAFGRVIAKLQAEVLRRDQLLEETSELVKSLTAEVESLRKQQDAGK
jgi:hypothetical protein